MKAPHQLHRSRRGGFTLIETLLVAGAVLAMTTLGIAGVNQQRVKAAGLNCGNNLRIYQEAKRAALEENPTMTSFSADQLRPYLPGGRIPACPGHGTYGNVSGFATATCSLDSGRTDGIHNVHTPGNSGTTNPSGTGGTGGPGGGVIIGPGGVGPGGGIIIVPGDDYPIGPILPPGDQEL